MGEVVYPSEERTEPFTIEEFNARLSGSISIEDIDAVHQDPIPLDALVVSEDHHNKGIRILVRPLTRSRSVSPGTDNCEWVALRAEVSDHAHQRSSKVLAVTQTHKDINFSIWLPGEGESDSIGGGLTPLWCELYYDPAGDSLILLNKSDVPILLARISHPDHNGDHYHQPIMPGHTKEVSPGSWRISIDGIPVLDFRILGKKPLVRRIVLESEESSDGSSSIADTLNSSMKRGRDDEDEDDASRLLGEDDAHTKRPRTMSSGSADENGVIVFQGPRDQSLVFPLPNATRTKEITLPNGQALLEVDKNETVAVPGGCELDQYQLTKRNQIATTAASSVYTAEHSTNGVITVKVLKTRPHPAPTGNAAAARHPAEAQRNVIRQADIWLREYQSQEDLKHESIVKLYGGDARYLSLYMEHVDGKDLAARGVWRDPNSDLFQGGRGDARRILSDIAGALHYVHAKNKIHNDIKPANILYSPDRGAVLCDFGLSTRSSDPATNGGTPFYVPPEFIGAKKRGPASDVWALGVTMLYVLRKIAFPDARGRQGHPRQLYWYIADLNRQSAPSRHGSRGQTAVGQMRQWLSEVNDARSRLDRRSNPLESLVYRMLAPNPADRITMARVISELFEDTNNDKDDKPPAAPEGDQTVTTTTAGQRPGFDRTAIATAQNTARGMTSRSRRNGG